MNYSVRHISVGVSLVGSDYQWKFTGFYGDPDRGLREMSWKLLSHLSSYSPGDWLRVGDFNEIVDATEKSGGLLRSTGQMEQFRNTLLECQLSDLEFRGLKFTWSNKRGTEEFVKERLDRTLATVGWCEKFPFVEVHVLTARCSDHKPLWIQMLP